MELDICNQASAIDFTDQKTSENPGTQRNAHSPRSVLQMSARQNHNCQQHPRYKTHSGQTCRPPLKRTLACLHVNASP